MGPCKKLEFIMGLKLFWAKFSMTRTWENWPYRKCEDYIYVKGVPEYFAKTKSLFNMRKYGK